MKPALFIDFDGTLCRDRFWQSLGANDYGRVSDFLFFNGGELVNRWMRGECASEQICEILAKELGIDYKILWDSLLNDCKSLRVSAKDLAKIGQLREDYSVALVTVNMDCFDRFTVPALGLDRHFDRIVNSFNEGVFKHGRNNGNRGGLFEAALVKLNAGISGSVLIDDSKNACAAFQELGGRALRVEQQKTLSYWLEDLLNSPK